MPSQIDTALVKAYRANIEIQFQQKISKLRPFVRVESQKAEFEFYDRIGPTVAKKVTDRHGNTVYSDTPHSRRRVGMEDYDWAELVDRPDKLRMLADPTSPYVQNAVMALNRAIDIVLVGAALSNAYTGKDGNTAVAYPTATNEVAVNYVESGGATNSNLNMAKLRRVRTLFDLDEAAEDDDAQIICALTAYQMQSLLRLTEVTSADYNTVRALVNGTVDTFMGIKFIKMAPSYLVKTGNNRQIVFFTRQGLLLAMGEEIQVIVGPNPERRNNTQLYVCGSFGASRMWEEKVRTVLCDETA